MKPCVVSVASTLDEVLELTHVCRFACAQTWSVPPPQETPSGEHDTVAQSSSDCYSSFRDLVARTESPEPCLAASCSNGNGLATAFAPSCVFDDDDGVASTAMSSEDTCSDAVLSSLCSSEDDDSSSDYFVKDELLLFEPSLYTASTGAALLPLSPPCGIIGADEQYHPALFGWDQFPPGLHPLELQAMQSCAFECVDAVASMSDYDFDALSRVHGAASSEQCFAAELETSFCSTTPAEFDGLVTHLSV